MFDCNEKKENETSTLSAPGQIPLSPAPPPRKKKIRQILSALGIGALLCFATGDFTNWQIHGNTVAQSPPAAVSMANRTRQQVIARARASVVWIYGQDCQKEGVVGTGSGAILDQRGYIVTNFHVVNRAFDYHVKLFDDSPWQPAQLVGVDPLDDLAVLKINTSKRLFVMPIGNSSQLQVGNSVLAIGNPDLAPQTATGGMVSALGRIENESVNGQSVPLIDMVQTDAAINPGNSGGALVNMQGELVGVPTLRKESVFTLLGFAVPSNRVRFVVPQLINYHRLIHSGHASIGVTAISMSAEIAAQNSLSVSQGALVTNVASDGPAARAGLKPNDVIVRLNGMPITNAQDLTDALTLVDAGSTVTLDIVRDGQHMQINVKTYEHLVKVASSWKCPLRDAQPVVGRG